MNDDTAKSSSDEVLSPPAARLQLHEALKEFSTLMLGMYDKTGKHPRLNARPMAVAKLEDDCTLLFITHASTVKSDDGAHLDGHVIGQSMTRQVSLVGQIEISKDRARLAEVWSLPFNVWFPGGKNDPNACLMIFRPRDAELWDSSGLKGLKYLFDSAKALVTRTVPEASPEQHQKVALHRS